MPDSRSDEAIFGFEVKVKHRRVGILAAGVMKMNADKDADPDIPIFKQANAEYAKLQ